MKKKKSIGMGIVFMFFWGACFLVNYSYLSFAAIDNFKGTLGYEIAQAVMKQNVAKIKKICKIIKF